MKVTIKSIADACHLSITSVSLVLNGKADHIPDETKKLILKTAKEMNYFPNPNAVGLAGGKTRIIGLIITDIGNMFLSEMSRIIETELRKYGYTIFLGNTGDNSKREMEYMREFIGKRVDGMILLHSSDASQEEDEEMRKIISACNIPVVMLDTDLENLDVMFCLLDNEQGGYIATKHLIEKGHVRIGSLLGPIGQSSVRKRLCGYRRALEEAGIAFDEELLYPGDFTIHIGARAMPYFLERNVTAIFAYNDMMAYGILAYAKEHGIQIGKDMALIGYDDSFINSLLEVPMSSVRQPRAEMAEMIAKILIDAIQQKHEIPSPVIFEPKLYIRESTNYDYRAKEADNV